MKEIKKYLNITCIALILISLAMYMIFRNEKMVVQIFSAMFILWGIKSIIDFNDGSKIQLIWYVVSSDASKGERTLWCWLSISLIVVSSVTLFKVSMGYFDYLY